jgi:hypothetical protein
VTDTAQISRFAGRYPLGKAFALNHDNSLKKTPLAQSVNFVTRVEVPTATALAATLESCQICQALALGTCHKVKTRVVTADREADWPDAVARTKANFHFAPGPAWALLDVDVKDAPPDIPAKLDRLGGVWAVLTAIYPPLATAARARRYSQSSCVRVADQPRSAPLSQHIYVLLASGEDTEALVTRLHQRLWLTGFGWIAIGRTGQQFERSLIDVAVASPERLIFEGPPVLHDSCLRIDASRRRVEAREGIPIVPPPPAGDAAETAYLDAVEEAQRALRKQAEHVAYDYQIQRGADPKTAGEMARGIIRKCVTLPLHQRLYFKNGEVVTVREALANPDRYVNQTCLDPVEAIPRDWCARFLRGKKDHTCFIKSFAHSGQIYQLQYDLSAAAVALENAPKDLRAEMYWSIVNKFELDV